MFETFGYMSTPTKRDVLHLLENTFDRKRFSTKGMFKYHMTVFEQF